MDYSLLDGDGGGSEARTFVVVLERGDLIVQSLTEFAAGERCRASELTAIGALEWARLAYFDVSTREYVELPLVEQCELLSLTGRITLPQGVDPAGDGADGAEPHLHIHCTVADRDGVPHGGHLLEAEVRPTCEIFVTDYPISLARRVDPDSRLAVIALR